MEQRLLGHLTIETRTLRCCDLLRRLQRLPGRLTIGDILLPLYGNRESRNNGCSVA